MNMFKPTTAKTPQEYIAMQQEPRKSMIAALDTFIKKTVPELKPFILAGMIGYGAYQYKSASGRKGEWAIIALANQKNYISLYVCAIKDGKYLAESYKEKLGKVSVGKSCIRFKKLEDINLVELKPLLQEAKKWPMGKVS